jgi:hypothetical protein
MSSTTHAFDRPPPLGLPAADRPSTAAVPPRPRVPAGWRRAAAALAVPALMLLASFGFRALALLQAVIDTDEGLYLVQAQAWLRGEWPLIAVWDMHPVGAPAMIALSLFAFGESVGAVRTLGILCVAATGWALFGLVRAAGGGRGLGVAPACSTSPKRPSSAASPPTRRSCSPRSFPPPWRSRSGPRRAPCGTGRRRRAGANCAPWACWSARRWP